MKVLSTGSQSPLDVLSLSRKVGMSNTEEPLSEPGSLAQPISKRRVLGTQLEHNEERGENSHRLKSQ
jgi:hypothetical protein